MDDVNSLSRRGLLSFGVAGATAGLLPAAAEPAGKVLVFVGPSNHPPGTHEVAASGRLLKHCLDRAGLPADLLDAWPTDPDALSAYAGVVFLGDYFPPAVVPESKRALAELGRRMDAGMGLVCVHYATGLTAIHVREDGDHPLLRWMGGYYATRCTHHKSVAKVFRGATVEPAADHPVTRGWKAFTFDDEPYINNYFGPGGPAKTVTVLATAMLPPDKPAREAVAWAVDRPDGGRGVGVVFPHFYRNWANPDVRTLVLNAVAWAAKREVPASGVRSDPPDLPAFRPAAVDPPAKKK
jgi:type 1 glutamine amidotransferase